MFLRLEIFPVSTFRTVKQTPSNILRVLSLFIHCSFGGNMETSKGFRAVHKWKRALAVRVNKSTLQIIALYFALGF